MKKSKFEKDNYRTPAELFEYYDLLHQFDTDLFASDENHLCERYFTQENSFLDVPAHRIETRICWANPPYSNPKIYIKKIVDVFNEYGCKIVALLPIDFSTEWFQLVLKNATEIQYIVGGRVPFINPVTGKGEKIMRGNMVAIFDCAHRGSSQVTRYVNIEDIYRFVGRTYPKGKQDGKPSESKNGNPRR